MKKKNNGATLRRAGQIGRKFFTRLFADHIALIEWAIVLAVLAIAWSVLGTK